MATILIIIVLFFLVAFYLLVPKLNQRNIHDAVDILRSLGYRSPMKVVYLAALQSESQEVEEIVNIAIKLYEHVQR